MPGDSNASTQQHKWERFAREVAAGKSYTDAYKSLSSKAKDPAKAGSALASNPEIQGRIKELTRRATNKVVERTAERVALTKEWVLEKLRQNAEEAVQVKGGSAVANRALELLGKELGLFRDPVDTPPLKLDDLPEEVLLNMLAEAEAKLVMEPGAEEIQGADAPALKKVN